MKKSYKITIDLPKGVTYQEIKEHITSAVRCWGGQYHPDDPLFEVNVISFGPVRSKKESK